jgi:Flp pilus assembly protein TadD
MKVFLPPLLILLALVSAPAMSERAMADAGGGSAPVRQADPDLTLAQQAIQDKNFAKAVELLSGLVARDDGNAEAHNLLGYSERMRGNLDDAFRHYERALALDPKHRGAHEYIGEAYLLAGNLPKAEEHLAKLDKLCFFSCEEYRDLKAAIAEYRGKHPN